MKRFLLTLALIALLACMLSLGLAVYTGGMESAGSSPGMASLPTSPGWHQIPNTKMQSVCPPNGFKNSGYDFSDSCHYVTDAWGGGAEDTKRNRMIVWGGGHSDYSGNEVYALDLNLLAVRRLTDPALPLSTGCMEALSGPTPNSRHSYDSLVYVPESDAMIVFSGSLAPTGCASEAAWKLDMESLQWTQLKPSGSSPVYTGGVAASSYDPSGRLVFISTESYGSFASYDYGANTYSMLNRHAITDYHESSVIDTKRRMFYLFGGNAAYVIDISGKDQDYKLKILEAKGCAFIHVPNPGVDFDQEQNLVVGWGGGDTVYLYNPVTDSCSSVTYPNGPGEQQTNGTNGRFRYFPSLNAFVLVNGFNQNAYVLRLTDRAAKESLRQQDSGSSTVSKKAEQSIPVAGALPMGQNTADAEEDFRSRCRAPDVIKCVGWDDPADFIPSRGGGGYADGLYPASDGTYQGEMDRSIKVSGAGSLKFTIRPRATSNPTGYWRANFGRLDKLTKFGPHTTFYLQFRLRLDADMLQFNWSTVSDSGWKVFIAYGPIPGPSCTGAQFVQENTYQTNVATAYTSCGAPALYSNNGVPPMLIEQGDYNCPYNHEGEYSSPKCFLYVPDKWLTEYWIVQIGDYGKPNTHFTAYVAPEGQPLKRFIDLPNFKFNSDPEERDGLETILLQPYLSGANGSKWNPVGHMWFDELIISTQAIKAPKH